MLAGEQFLPPAHRRRLVAMKEDEASRLPLLKADKEAQLKIEKVAKLKAEKEALLKALMEAKMKDLLEQNLRQGKRIQNLEEANRRYKRGQEVAEAKLAKQPDQAAAPKPRLDDQLGLGPVPEWEEWWEDALEDNDLLCEEERDEAQGGDVHLGEEVIAELVPEQLPIGLAGPVLDSDVEKAEEERINMSSQFVQKKGLDNGAVYKEIVAEEVEEESEESSPSSEDDMEIEDDENGDDEVLILDPPVGDTKKGAGVHCGEKAKVKAMVKAKVKDPELIIFPEDRGKLSIFTRDYVQLKEGEYVGDQMVNLHAKIQQSQMSLADKRRVIILPSQFYLRLERNGSNDFTPLTRWAELTGGGMWERTELFLLPVCRRGHWVLLVGVMGERPGVVELNSLRAKGKEDELGEAKLFASFLASQRPADYRILTAVTPQQTNLKDCALFVMKNMEKVLEDINLFVRAVESTTSQVQLAEWYSAKTIEGGRKRKELAGWIGHKAVKQREEGGCLAGKALHLPPINFDLAEEVDLEIQVEDEDISDEDLDQEGEDNSIPVEELDVDEDISDEDLDQEEIQEEDQEEIQEEDEDISDEDVDLDETQDRVDRPAQGLRKRKQSRPTKHRYFRPEVVPEEVAPGDDLLGIEVILGQKYSKFKGPKFADLNPQDKSVEEVLTDGMSTGSRGAGDWRCDRCGANPKGAKWAKWESRKTRVKKAEMRNHIESAHFKGLLRYVCQSTDIQGGFCREWVGSQTAIRQHMVRHMADRRKLRRDVPSSGSTCPYCQKWIKTHVKRHVQDHHRPRDTPCPFCAKVFTSANKMYSHRSYTHGQTGEVPLA
jgi:hypothetical protein